MTASRVTPAATSEDDSPLYRQWIEAEWWALDGGLNDAIGIALDQKPIVVSLPGEPRQYGFNVDQQAAQRVLEHIDAAKKCAKRNPSVVDAALVSRFDKMTDEELLAPIEVEVPDDCAWDVPEQGLGGMVMVRSREFVDWADCMRYSVPPVVVEGVRAKFQRLDGHDDFAHTAHNDMGEGVTHVTEDSTNRPPASAAEIKMHFCVFPDANKSHQWWRKMMRNASDNERLKECRVGEGRKGRGGGSLWRPDLVAGWLVDRQEKGKEGGMKTQDARKALKKFPAYSDFADHLFPSET